MNLKDLSDKLGLSQTTVSRALNGYPEVKESTRLKVVEAADRFNYQPNSRAKGLATGRAMVIGHVISSSNAGEMVNPVFGDFVAGASRAYTARGYDMIITHTQDGEEKNTYEALARNARVDGVVLQGPKINDPRIGILNELKMPFVVHGRSSGVSTPYSWVDVNNQRAFQRATEFLVDLGHKRIALINGWEALDFAYRRRQGYLTALQNAGIEPDESLMRSAEMTEVYGHRETLDMLNLPSPPTAILAASMLSAIGVRRAIEEIGLKMGRDVSVVTHDDELSYLKNGLDVPIFTATRSSVRDAGVVLAEMLIDQISNPDAPPRNQLLEAELVLGTSTGPALVS